MYTADTFVIFLAHIVCRSMCQTNIHTLLSKQAFVGVTALLAAFPPCMGVGEGNENQESHPLLTGSVCRVRDSHDFLDVSHLALHVRMSLALKYHFCAGISMTARDQMCRIYNSDEKLRIWRDFVASCVIRTLSLIAVDVSCSGPDAIFQRSKLGHLC